MEQLKRVILESITEVYKKCYLGHLKITKLLPCGYDVALGLDCDEKPYHIAASLEGLDFIEYFKQELRRARLSDSHFYTGYKTLCNYKLYPINHNCDS